MIASDYAAIARRVTELSVDDGDNNRSLNERLLGEIITCQNSGMISDRLNYMIARFVADHAGKPSYHGQPITNEMLDIAVQQVRKGLLRVVVLKVDYCYPLAYLSSIVRSSFCNSWAKARFEHHE